MKKKSFLILFVFGIALLPFLSNCKKTCEQRGDCNNPVDSSYISTPYNLVLPFRFPAMKSPDDNPMTNEGVDLGHYLFYDPILSVDSSMACARCHAPENAFADNRPISLNVSGIPTRRHSPPIQNIGWMKKIFWDGRVSTVEDQVRDAIVGELHINWTNTLAKLKASVLYAPKFRKAFASDDPSQDQVVKAIAQFMRSMVNGGNAEIDIKLFRTNDPNQLSAAAKRGYDIFTTERGDCFHCHFSSPLMTDNIFHNNGLDSSATYYGFVDRGLGETTGDTTDYGKFKTPSLRNITLTAPYMHDGRFATLRDVINFYSSGVHWSPTIDPMMKKVGNHGLQLTEAEKDDLISFLETMTDTGFVNDTRFINPFK